MKKIFGIIVLSLLLGLTSKADDISDFEIEGIKNKTIDELIASDKKISFPVMHKNSVPKFKSKIMKILEEKKTIPLVAFISFFLSPGFRKLHSW